MKKLLLLLIPTLLLAQSVPSPDQSSIQFTLPNASATYTITLVGGATQLSNSVQPNAQLLELIKDLTLLANGTATSVNIDGSLVLVSTGTTPTPNVNLTNLLNKYVTKVTTTDGSTLFSH